ncbi:MAG TPA: hypothetical protein VG206_23400 [Terriglobia bacterium]|nr:hypothetical protein [Terriglobia bacterium]
MIDLRREIPESGKTLTVLLGLAAVLVVVWLVSQSIVSKAAQEVALLGAALAALAVAGKTLSDWRTGVYLFLTWLLFEDLIRKYMGNNMTIYFGKDALIAITYVSFLMDSSRREIDRFRPPFKYALGLFFLLGLAQGFNPGSPSVWYGVLGLKLYFYYAPLMFVGYALVRTERDLQKFLFVDAGLAAVISLVGILQAIIGQDFLNPRSGADINELAHNVRVTPSGLAVPRPPSVFVSEGRSFDYLTLALALGLGTVGYLLLRTKRGRKLVFPAVALVAVAIVMSGSRGGFVYAVVSALVLSAAMLWGAPAKAGEGYRLVKAIRRTFIFVALGVSLAVVLFPSVIGARLAFYRETISPYSPDSETADRAWNYPVGQLQAALADPDWLIGHGIGTASLGGQYVSRIMEVPATRLGVESGYGALIIELGILGLVVWLVWTSSMMLAACKALLKLKGTWAFPVGLSIVWFAFYLLFPRTYGGMQGYQDFVLNAYLWLLIGMLFRLPALVAQEASQQSIVESRE